MRSCVNLPSSHVTIVGVLGIFRVLGVFGILRIFGILGIFGILRILGVLRVFGIFRCCWSDGYAVRFGGRDCCGD